MRSTKRLLIALVPVLALGACSTFTAQDRATLNAASQNAEQAKQMAQQALTASQEAQKSAAQAAAEAKAANEKADRMFQRSLRKK